MCLSGGRRVSSSGDWDSGNPAFAISHGSRNASPLTPSHDRCFADMLLFPFTFRIWVSHWTQEPSFEFLPAAPGIQQSASRRNSLLGHPMPAEELGPPRGRLTGHARRRARTSTGLPRSARVSCSRGGCPLYPGDGGAPPGQVVSLTGACRSAAASPFHPAPASHLARLCLTRHQRGFKQFTRPAFPSPAAARMERAAAWAFPRASHPADQEPTTHARVETGHGHGPGTTRSTSHQPILQSCSSLTACDLVSHDDWQKRSRRPSALPFTDGQAQAASVCQRH